MAETNEPSGERQLKLDKPGAAINVSWMKQLAQRYEATRREHPSEPLLLACDIDGTIIDMRYVVLSVLQSYDRAYRTAHFARLVLSDITVHENQVELLLDELRIEGAQRARVLDWFDHRKWHEDTLLNVHRPFPGALPMIRWFQLRPDTEVALVTGRPEHLREITLRSLNLMGEPYRVAFSDELLLMNPNDWDEGVAEQKVAAIDRLRSRGHHVFAMIDNEPATLDALSAAPQNSDLLLLHANTIFESLASRPTPEFVSGDDYRLTELVADENALPEQVQLVWHGVNDSGNLRQFAASSVKWAEVDVREDPAGALILRHDSFESTPAIDYDGWITLEEALTSIRKNNRSVKLDIKVARDVLDHVFDLVKDFGFRDEDLWFNGDLEAIGENGFREIASRHPGSIVQCSIDWLVPLMRTASDEARRILELLSGWGISRFSISWDGVDVGGLVVLLHEWGYEVNIYNVPDLEAFLEAVMLLPRSVTSDFNFPQWNFYGAGSGKDGRRLTYSVDDDVAN